MLVANAEVFVSDPSGDKYKFEVDLGRTLVSELKERVKERESASPLRVGDSVKMVKERSPLANKVEAVGVVAGGD